MIARRFSGSNVSAELWRGVLAGVVAGIVGSWAKSLLEPPLQRLCERVFPPAAGEKELRGADITSIEYAARYSRQPGCGAGGAS